MNTRREKSNPRLTTLITLLRDTSRENQVAIWRDIAERLEGSCTRYAEVNVSKINRYAANGETVLIPGKVLGSGVLERQVNVAALTFSASSSAKINGASGRCMTIEELVQSNPKGSQVRILR